jgi:hypothetical protein
MDYGLKTWTILMDSFIIVKHVHKIFLIFRYKMMNKPFLCGRLVINKDGAVKKLPLSSGGGSRSCNWTSVDMTFNEIHDSIRETFSIGNTKIRIVLYALDFLQILNSNQ